MLKKMLIKRRRKSNFIYIQNGLYCIIFFFFNIQNALSKDSFVDKFAVVKNKETNVRNGPGDSYKILWTFNRKNVPIEILNKIDNWYMIKDSTNEIGWINETLISRNIKRRMGVIIKNTIEIFQLPNSKSFKIAILNKDTIVRIISCGETWCRISVNNNITGWLKKKYLWGVLKNEKF